MIYHWKKFVLEILISRTRCLVKVNLFYFSMALLMVWMPGILRFQQISSNHTVIAFDQRGIGNTTAGSEPYTYQQLANDSAGLLDALKIPKADVLGYSLGFIFSPTTYNDVSR